MDTLTSYLKILSKIAGTLAIVTMVACAGADGKDGAPGEAGLAGLDGNDGDDGGDGKDGSDGDTGATGGDGADGGSCDLVKNADGTSTITCADGSSITVSDGSPGLKAAVKDFHGRDYLIAKDLEVGKELVVVNITSASAGTDGILTVNFEVKTKDGDPVTTVPSVNGSVAKLVSTGASPTFTEWIPYVWTSSTAGTGAWNNAPWSTPATTVAWVGNADRTGTLTNLGSGNYSYRFAKNLATAARDGVLVGYDRAKKHRVVIRMGGSSGPTGDDSFDFVPDGSTVTLTRNIVETQTCYECHGETLFKAHGGDRLAVDDCVSCHVARADDPQSGETIDMKVMIHKIHAGGELQSIPGADGKVWDDPATPGNEAADNGAYAIWGYRNEKHEWWKVGFPAILSNCTKCHQGGGADVDNWKTKPSRAACGSCHDKVDFATGLNHPGGAWSDDQTCDNCHQPNVNGAGYSVVNAHDFKTTDPAQPLYDVRAIPEFSVELTVSTPANGTHFMGNEAPIVYLKLRDAGTGLLIDHTTVQEDSAAESCTKTLCVARDGLFRAALLFVHGPRHDNKPVLTTAARAALTLGNSATYNLGTSGSLTFKVDGGADYVYRDSSNGDKLALGTFTVSWTAASAWSPDPATAVTAAKLVSWLNAQSAFNLRAIAYVQGSSVMVRSRGLAKVTSTQLTAQTGTNVFTVPSVVALPSGSTTSNDLRSRTTPSNNDPKATRTTGYIAYQLDPVTDLKAGTYMVNVEVGDRGNSSDTDYKTPSIARASFQVKTATADKFVSANCSSCHQNNHGDPGEGDGLIVDARRHNKRISMEATDLCLACHDEQPQNATGTAWSGARPINKRVHAIHNGSKLTYPLLTVDYSGGDIVKGRNWRIDFPQDIRNCQSCHVDGLTSGTWATKPTRLACIGCHDTDAAQAHIKGMTYDPTPADWWSGDEAESCAICH